MRLRGLLEAVERVRVSAVGITQAEAGRLLSQTFQNIEVADWATDQGVAKMWFTYASEADRHSLAQALDNWMDSACELIVRPY